jgi:hypothetical protein
MRTQSSDTSPEAERVQIELLRKAGAAGRIELFSSLNKSVIQWSRAGIRKAHPEASENELAVLFVALCYGQKLADGLRADLARRQQT